MTGQIIELSKHYTLIEINFYYKIYSKNIDIWTIFESFVICKAIFAAYKQYKQKKWFQALN